MPLSLKRGRVTRVVDVLHCEVDGVPAIVYPDVTGPVEEDDEVRGGPDRLGGLPVVLCTVHSQVAPAWAALCGLQVAYVQVAGGALPLEISETVRALTLAARISVAPCFGGDARCVSVA